MNEAATKTTHTPGPWEAIMDSAGSNPDIAINAGDWGIVADIGGGPLTIRKANAAVIAAAPDTLAACKEVLEDLEIYQRDDQYHLTPERVSELFDVLRNAIAKAEGKAGAR